MNSKRKRPIVCASRDDYCATPPMARKIDEEKIKKLRESLSGHNTSLGLLLSDSNCKPCTMFETSLASESKVEDSFDSKLELLNRLEEDIELGICR